MRVTCAFVQMVRLRSGWCVVKLFVNESYNVNAYKGITVCVFCVVFARCGK
jgi:hypothetical protein